MARPADGATAERIRVDLGLRSYDIDVGSGLLAGAGPRIRPLLAQPRLVIVTDETVARLHLDALAASLTAAGIEHATVVLPAGERTKDFPHLADLCDRVLAAGLERGTTLLALGGGVIGDITGFAAGILLRGLDFVQVPTTLLAQVDSSVGGKTGINTRQGKNLVGLFHQPRLVLADVATLATLDDRELRAGYAEVVKYGLLGDAAFFAWLETNATAVLARDPRRCGGRSRSVAAPRLPSSAPTSAKAACGRCSTSATPSATPWRRKPALARHCCTAKRWPSAWRWPSISRRAWAWRRPKMRRWSAGISPACACPPTCRCCPVTTLPQKR